MISLSKFYRFFRPMALLLVPVIGFSQKLPVRNYTNENGLPQSQISSITQDSKGFIWLISSSGLTRYDGFEFRTYTKQDGLSSNIGIEMLGDKNGSLWALMVNGISVFDVAVDGYIRSLKKIDSRNGLPSLDYTCMHVDQYGFLWVGSRNAGVLRLNMESVNGIYKVNSSLAIGKAQGLAGNAVTKIFQDKENRLWIGTENGLSLIVFNSETKYTVTNFTNRHGLGSNFITCIVQNPAGEIWVGTKSGLNKLVDIISSQNPYKFRNFTTSDGLMSNEIRDIAVDIPGNLWVATAKGISKLNFSQFADQSHTAHERGFIISNYTSENGLMNNSIRSIFTDRENNIWISAFSSGISKISTEKFHTLTESEGLAGNAPGPLLEDLDGRIWVGTNNGISIIASQRDLSNPVRYTTRNLDRRSGLPNLNILDLSMDKDGTVWAATEDGTARFDFGVFTPYPDKSILSNSNTRQIEFDDDGNLWIGTVSGLNRVTENGNLILTSKDGLPNDYIRKMIKDHRGNLWIGTNNGLCRIDREELSKPSPKISNFARLRLPEKIINVLYEDRQHDLWIGSDDALLRLNIDDDADNKNLTAINSSEAGFKNTIITCIDQDASGHLWISTRHGLHQFDPQKQRVINIYYKSDGLAGNEGSLYDAMIVDKQGNMWISFLGGVTRYFPKIDFENRQTVPVYIKKFSANNITYSVDQPIELNYDDRNVDIHFLGILFRNEESLQFQYQLEGFDNTWSTPASTRQVRYTNLDHGRYTFRCSTAVSNNSNSSGITELTFSIRPPFWKQWWFYVLMPMLMTGLGYVMYQNRIRVIKRRNTDLEDRIQIRTQEVKKQNEEINKQREILEQQKQKLENTIRELTKTQTDLIHSKKMASLVQIVAGIAHEMNNPLANIYGNATHFKEYVVSLKQLLATIDAEILNNAFRTPEEFAEKKAEIERLKVSIDYEYMLRDIHNILLSFEKSANRMMQIVKDLRKFSRLDESETKEININDNLGNIIELFMNQYRFSIKITKNFAPLPPILCYPQELSQAFMQVLLNAAQAILEYQEYALREIRNENSILELDVDRGHIWIETRVIQSASMKNLELSLQEIDSGLKKSFIQIKIKDDGIGIDAAMRDRIFDPFFTTRKIGDGVGLGLSVAYSIIEKHQGKIFFSSERFEGTEFIIELPVRNHLSEA
ncbi:hypothetical protein JNM05_07840 [bacterium]|nr:hypothetical protein [bacterium]